jgi:F-type H+-transporting ATPase subunit b
MARSFSGSLYWLVMLALVSFSFAGNGSLAVAQDDAVAETHAADKHGDDPHAEHEAADHGDAHGGGGGTLLSADPGAAIWNLLIFLSVLAILTKFVWPPILAGLQARENHIREDLEGADRANKEARVLLTEYNQRLSQAQTEVQGLLAQARKDAEVSAKKIVEQAREESDQQKNRALADIEMAKRAALAEMADQTTDIAVQMARQMIGRELKAEDHAEVVRQALQGLPSKN